MRLVAAAWLATASVAIGALSLRAVDAVDAATLARAAEVGVAAHVAAGAADGAASDAADAAADGARTDAADVSADVAVAMSGPASIAPGGSVSYPITVTNLGDVDATDVEVVDELPARLRFGAADGGPFTQDGGTVRWALGTLEPGESRALRLDATVPVTAQVARVVNRASVETTADEERDDNNAAEVGSDVLPVDLRVEVTTPVAEVRPGEAVTHTVSLHNVSVVPAENVRVEIVDGPWTEVVTDTAQSSGFARALAPDGVRWTRDRVPPVQSLQVDVVSRVRPDASSGARVALTATVVADTVDNVMANNTRSHDVVVAVPDLRLVKTGPPEVGVGGPVTYTIVYGNDGPGDAPGTHITDVLPIGVRYVSSLPAATEVAPGVLVWDRGTVPEGASDVLRVQARVDTDRALGETITNTARIGASFSDAEPGDNESVAVARVVEGPPATVELRAPDQLQVGGASGVVTATVRDGGGHLVADGTAVVLDTTLGRLGAQHLRTQDGQVSTEIASGPVPGVARLTAAAGASYAERDIVFVSGPPDEVRLEASLPEPVVGQQVDIDVTVQDAFGNRVADGMPVVFDASIGVITPTVTTTQLGRAHATWTSQVATAGVLTVTSGSAAASVERRFAPDAPQLLALDVGRASIGVGGETTPVTATVRDRFGNRVVDGTVVSFDATGGTVRPSSGPTSDGTAKATLEAGEAPGWFEVTGSAAAAAGRVAVELRPADVSLEGGVAGPRGPTRATRTYPGEVVTYTLRAANEDRAVARGLVLGASLPPSLGAVVVGATRPITPTEQPPEGFSVGSVAENDTRYWRLPALDPSDALTVTLTGRLDRSLAWSAFQTLFTQAAITTTTAEASLDDLDHTDQVGVYGADHYIGVELDSGASRVEPGGLLVHEISFGNETSGTDGTVRITNTLPASASYDHWQAGPATTIRSVGRFDSTSRQLVWEVDGADATTGRLRVWLNIASNAVPEQALVNEVSIGATVYDVNRANNTATDGGVWLRGVNLVTRVDAPATIAPGQPLPVAVTVENGAVRDGATDVVLVVEALDDLVLRSTDPPALVLGDGRLMWRRERLAAGDELAVTMTWDVPGSLPPGTVFVHAAEAASEEPDSYPGDNARVAVTSLIPGPTASIELTADDPEIAACGGRTGLLARLFDEWGNPVADGTSVAWGTSLGRLVDASDVTSDGVAGATLVAARAPGAARITAASGTASGHVDVDLVPGPPASLAVSADPRIVGHGGRTSIHVSVLDACANGVADGWPIALQADRGVFANGDSRHVLPTEDAHVRASLWVGEQPGPLRVTARYGAVVGQTMVTVDARAAEILLFVPAASTGPR